MNLPLLHSLGQTLISYYAWMICFVSIGRESFACRRSEIANGRGAGVKPHTKFAAVAIVMIASSSVVEAQDGRPTTASSPGTTRGPWTSVKPGNSESRCGAGEYAVGIEVEVAPRGAKPCAGCVSRLPRYLPALRYLIICRLRPSVWCAGRRLLTVRQSPASSASPRLERSVRDPQFPGLEAYLRRPRCGTPATRA